MNTPKEVGKDRCALCGSENTDGLVAIPNTPPPIIQRNLTDRRYCYDCDSVYAVQQDV